LAVFVGLASAADSVENDRLLAQLDLESLKQAAAQLPSLMGGGPVNQVILYHHLGPISSNCLQQLLRAKMLWTSISPTKLHPTLSSLLS
jgi:hypothetical protein